MTFETGYRFGKHAAEINAAYERMYESSSVNEEITPQSQELIDAQSPVSKAFTSDFMSKSRRGQDSYEDDLIEMTDGIERFDADFNKKLENLKRAISPQLLKMAKEHGHRFNYDDIVSSDVEQPVRRQQTSVKTNDNGEVSAKNDDAEFDDEPTEQGDYAENLFQNIVDGNPDEFGSEYDIDEMKKHAKEIYDLAMPQIENAVDPVVAVKNACEQIPGCMNSMPDSVGHIDGDNNDVEADDTADANDIGNTAQTEFPHRYFVFLKEYYPNGDDKYLNLYDNEEFWFDDIEEAKKTARNYLNLINRKSDGSIDIESVKSRVVVAKIFDHGENGMQNASVYSISNNSYDMTVERIRKNLKKFLYEKEFMNSTQKDRKLAIGLKREKCDEYLVNRGGGEGRDTRIDKDSTIDVNQMLDSLEQEMQSVVGDDEESIRKRQEILARKGQLRDAFRSERTAQRQRKKREQTVADLASEY